MIAVGDEVSTPQEIKKAIAHLNAHHKALLAAELFAMNTEPDEVADGLQSPDRRERAR
jgi:hypothetical protein